MSCLLK